MNSILIGQLNDSKSVIRSIADAAERIVDMEILEFNTALKESKAWSDREVSIKEDNLALIFVVDEIKRFQTIQKEFVKDSIEYDELQETIDKLECNITWITRKALDSEFGIIPNDTYGAGNRQFALVAGMDSNDMQKAIDQTVDLIKKDLEIYI